MLDLSVQRSITAHKAGILWQDEVLGGTELAQDGGAGQLFGRLIKHVVLGLHSKCVGELAASVGHRFTEIDDEGSEPEVVCDEANAVTTFVAWFRLQ